MRRRPVWSVLSVLVLGLVLSACRVATGADTDARPQSVLEPAGPIAEIQHRAWGILFPVAAVVFILVVLALIWLLVRYRARPGDDEIPAQIADNRIATRTWLVATIALLAVVKVSTYVVAGESVGAEPADDALEVRVVGKQYWWEFEYTAREYVGLRTANELHIPVGRDIGITMESISAALPDAGSGNQGAVLDGVIHSFWVPQLGGKLDVVPGTTRQMVIHADEPGVYPGQCAEFCGLAHANMRFTVHAHDPADFDAWIAEQTAPVDLENLDGVAVAGSEAFVNQACIECHAIRGFEDESGLRADIRVGPDLTKFNTRSTFAGGTFDVDDDEQLAAWLRDPAAAKPGAQMPNLNLSERDITTLIAFLRSLD